MTEPIQYRSACGCVQYESGRIVKCQRHALADWQAARALEANPVTGWWEEAA